MFSKAELCISLFINDSFKDPDTSLVYTVPNDKKVNKQFFLIRIVKGGVQLGPLGTVAINRPIVPPPSDYDVG
jgi:hypothetical protein